MNRNSKVGRIINDLPNKSKTPLEKCISRIDNEINLIKNRTNLDLLKVSKKINYPVVPAEFYPSLKEYYSKMVGKLNEKVVLIKVEN